MHPVMQPWKFHEHYWILIDIISIYINAAFRVVKTQQFCLDRFFSYLYLIKQTLCMYRLPTVCVCRDDLFNALCTERRGVLFLHFGSMIVFSVIKPYFGRVDTSFYDRCSIYKKRDLATEKSIIEQIDVA